MRGARLPRALLAMAIWTAAGCSPPSPDSTSADVNAAADPSASAPAAAAEPVRASAAALPLAEYRNGWSDADRRLSYHLSEGGEVLPLSLLQALERARTPEDPPGPGLVPFMQNLERYGFIPDEKSAENPFGLPIGWTIDRDRATNSLKAGFNCSTCHVGEAWRNGRRVRLDGAPNMLRLNDLFADVKTELTATLAETGRRRRFEARLVSQIRANDAISPVGKTLLQRGVQLVENLDTVRQVVRYLEGMPTLAYASTGIENGYGRVDAFGVARNALFGSDPRNVRPQNAPVSLPHMWGIETTAWLQWGANMNSVMERNIGQALGVGATYNLTTLATTARLDNLNVLEHQVYKLTPPAWPTDVFGPIDDAKAAAGRAIYDRACANCHEKPFAVSETGLISYQLFPLEHVGTSPDAARNFDEMVWVDGKQVRFADAAFAALEQIKREYYRANKIAEETQALWEGRDRRPPPEWAPRLRSTLAEAAKYPDAKAGGGRGGVYPAKPLAGIWATAPYLVNGSVATMWDLLTPPAQRPTKFTLGSREYDPTVLGYRTTPDPSSPAPPWELHTTIRWNTSAGHVYGTNLSDDEKWALIEFLKALKPNELTKPPLQRPSSTGTN